MDIYSFINSKDIAAHCRKLEHQFTPVEMAFLIHESQKHTIPEKHTAYRELIETMPDMEVAVDGWKSGYNSLHDFLKRYMEIENKYLERFYRDEPDCIYSYEYEEYYRLGNFKEAGCLHKSFEACCQELKNDIKDRGPILDIQIKKQWILGVDNDFCDMVLHISTDNVPMELEMYHYLEGGEADIENTWEDLWPVMPTPFKKGDILAYRSRGYEEVLVIEWIPYWEDKDMCSRILGHDRSCPHTKAYRQDEDGSIYRDTAPIYMNMEFYDKELKGEKRILKAISNYLKGEIDFEILIAAYSHLMRDEYVDEEDTHMFALLGEDLFKGKAGVRGPFKKKEKEEVPVQENPLTGIYRFINSKAIADHCSKIQHQFDPLEMAYLIHESEKHTIPEKHAAWKQLIETTPDMEIKERPWVPHFDSLHDFLKQYMAIENKYLDRFYRDEPGCIYSYQYLYDEDSSYCEDEGIYADFVSCYKSIQTELDEPEKIVDIRVTKQWFNREGDEWPRKMTLCMTCDNIPVQIWECRGCMEKAENQIFSAFEGLWPEIPTPFQKGDILINKSKYTPDPDPFVLDRLPYWTEEGKYQGYVDGLREHGDSSDLIARGYGQEYCGTLQYVDIPTYLDVDYYQEDLVGIQRTLIAVSEFLKGELDIEALMYAYDLIKCKNFVTHERWHLEDYVEEVSIKAGIKEEKSE